MLVRKRKLIANSESSPKSGLEKPQDEVSQPQIDRSLDGEELYVAPRTAIDFHSWEFLSAVFQNGSLKRRSMRKPRFFRIAGTWWILDLVFDFTIGKSVKSCSGNDSLIPLQMLSSRWYRSESKNLMKTWSFSAVFEVDVRILPFQILEGRLLSHFEEGPWVNKSYKTQHYPM